jgi:hypothetical protein
MHHLQNGRGGKAVKCPCQNCEFRKAGCHASCNLYSEWRKEKEREKQAAQNHISTMFLIDQVKKQNRKNKRN